MKQNKLITLLTLFLIGGFLAACGNSSGQNDIDTNDNDEKVHEEIENEDENDEDTEENSEETTDDSDQETTESENSTSNEENDELATYSAEEIEYARIWYQLGDTQDIDELNVEYIAAGESLNPEDESSLEYPEDVVQLTSSRLAEGIITYHSNGDGTITLYKKVPQRWDGENPAGEETYEKILEDTEEVAIEATENDEIENLIGKIHIIN